MIFSTPRLIVFNSALGYSFLFLIIYSADAHPEVHRALLHVQKTWFPAQRM
jgi:hypothetical protein